jgi:ribosomal RNA methyltransferase Nop2
MGPKTKKKGPSRRMQKQGPPAPLNEARVTRKRAGYEAPPKPEPKRRRIERDPPKLALKNGKANGKANEKPPPADSSDESLDDDSDGGVNITGLDALGGDSDDDAFDMDGSDVVDSDEDDRPRGLWSEDEDSDDAREQLTAANIESLSRKLDRELAQEEEDAEAELEDANMQTNIAGDRPKLLHDGSDDDEAAPRHAAPDLKMLRDRIMEAVRVLENFSTMAEEGRSRSEYTEQILKDISAYYGYSPFLAEKLFHLFPPREAVAFFEANETPRPVVLRTNTLKTNRRALAQALINRGVHLEPVGKWTKEGLQVFETTVPLGATPEYLSGQYMLQAAASFLPALALGAKPGERVLDMAAAPGGKSTHIAAMMRNSGTVVANDASRTRARALVANAHRLGVRCALVTCLDAAAFPKLMPAAFDRVLLDAPCSGTGVVSKDASVKTNRAERDFVVMPERQKKLLLAAIDCARAAGGTVVYSTCSVAVEENEAVVDYALRRRPNVRLVKAGLDFGRPGFARYRGKTFSPSLVEARRFYPHSHNLDGFFVAKFEKFAAFDPEAARGASDAKAEAEAVRPVEAGAEDAGEEGEEGAGGDGFGGWNDSEDEELIRRALKSRARKRGVDPRVALRGKPPREKAAAGE